MTKGLNLNPNRMRNRTLIQLRAVAILGQFGALLVARVIGGIELDYWFAFTVIICWFQLNVFQFLFFMRVHRLTPRYTTLFLFADLIEITALLFVTGGIHNPFCVLIIVPTLIAANTLPKRPFSLISLLTICFLVLITFEFKVVTVGEQAMLLTPIQVFGHFVSICIGMLFLAFFTQRISNEALTLARAVSASELALQREHRLSSLGSLVAAYAHELGTPLANIRLTANDLLEEKLPAHVRDDVLQIRSEVLGIAEILQNMGQIGHEDSLTKSVPFSFLIEEAARPHEQRGKEIEFKADLDEMPMVMKSSAIIHAFRNIIQNAVDFSDSRVEIKVEMNSQYLFVIFKDDGDGFSSDVMSTLGEPYVKSKNSKHRPEYTGMGLGVFISKTLLESTGASVHFSNVPDKKGSGAIVRVRWLAEDIVLSKQETRGSLEKNMEQNFD